MDFKDYTTIGEVQILEVVHDNETGMNIGGMMVDNQEVILIDVDNDQTFDVMASDLNVKRILHYMFAKMITGRSRCKSRL